MISSSRAATVSGSANEPSEFSVKYGTSQSSLGSSEGNSGFSLSTEIDLLLDAETTYYYNLTACDRSGNCGTSGTSSFTTTMMLLARVLSLTPM